MPQGPAQLVQESEAHAAPFCRHLDVKQTQWQLPSGRGRASLLATQADIRGGLEVPTLSADLERCVLHGGHACAKPWAGRGSRGGEPCR